MRQLIRLRWVFHLLLPCCSPVAPGQGISEHVSTRPGVPVLVTSAKCIFEPVKNSGTSLLKDPDGNMWLAFTPDALLRQNAVIYLEGFVVNLQAAQEVPEETVGTAFRVLIAALVMAILLESAFELLFNWRLFQAYFVGNAWRTPLMFLISLLVTEKFGIDVLRPVFDAYSGLPKGTTAGGWLTAVLTAMILAGGSVGVNRLMTRLGIRSPFPNIEKERASLEVTEAFVSVTALPAILGLIGPVRPVWRQSQLFPSKWRISPSGGIRVSVNKTYRFSVTDLRTNTLYDMAGNLIRGQTQAPRGRFAQRPFVDLVVVLK